MYVIPKMRLNKFLYVKAPTRRQIYDQFNQAGRLREQLYRTSPEGEEYTDPVNFTDGMNKVDLMTTGSDLLKQSKASDDSRSSK